MSAKAIAVLAGSLETPNSCQSTNAAFSASSFVNL